MILLIWLCLSLALNVLVLLSQGRQLFFSILIIFSFCIYLWFKKKWKIIHGFGAFICICQLIFLMSTLDMRQKTRWTYNTPLVGMIEGTLREPVSTYHIGTKDAYKFIFDVDHAEAFPGIRRVELSASCYEHNLSWQASQIWRLYVRIKPLHSYENDGVRSQSYTWLLNGIDARGVVLCKYAPIFLGFNDALFYRLAFFRQQKAEEMMALLPSSNYVGMIQALTLGLKTNISEIQWMFFNVLV